MKAIVTNLEATCSPDEIKSIHDDCLKPFTDNEIKVSVSSKGRVYTALASAYDVAGGPTVFNDGNYSIELRPSTILFENLHKNADDYNNMDLKKTRVECWRRTVLSSFEYLVRSGSLSDFSVAKLNLSQNLKNQQKFIQTYWPFYDYNIKVKDVAPGCLEKLRESTIGLVNLLQTMKIKGKPGACPALEKFMNLLYPRPRNS